MVEHSPQILPNEETATTIKPPTERKISRHENICCHWWHFVFSGFCRGYGLHSSTRWADVLICTSCTLSIHCPVCLSTHPIFVCPALYQHIAQCVYLPTPSLYFLHYINTLSHVFIYPPHLSLSCTKSTHSPVCLSAHPIFVCPALYQHIAQCVYLPTPSLCVLQCINTLPSVIIYPPHFCVSCTVSTPCSVCLSTHPIFVCPALYQHIAPCVYLPTPSLCVLHCINTLPSVFIYPPHLCVSCTVSTLPSVFIYPPHLCVSCTVSTNCPVCLSTHPIFVCPALYQRLAQCVYLPTPSLCPALYRHIAQCVYLPTPSFCVLHYINTLPHVFIYPPHLSMPCTISIHCPVCLSTHLIFISVSDPVTHNQIHHIHNLTPLVTNMFWVAALGHMMWQFNNNLVGLFKPLAKLCYLDQLWHRYITIVPCWKLLGQIHPPDMTKTL